MMQASMSDHADSLDLGAVLPGNPRERRRMIAGSALRIVATALGLLVLYAFVPIPTGTSGAGAFIGLMIGLAVFIALVGWQIRTITRAEHPVMRAVEVIALALPLLAVVFAFTYLSISRADSASVSEHLSRVDAMYYTVSTISTVGFGDIEAESDAARTLVTVQMLFDLALIAGLVRLVIVATRTGLQRRSVSQEPRATDV
jgi:voltage-gated potassium channel